ncbi:hypothetical protein [Pedobacter foliorum]|uniref:hypothetical protein n=1 Tax=Pedobacter foliorum TaxID=2739058 RepID=UPI0015648F87|nr:hypothetical protein [Pedobacter foliorum]NRF37601.1 hypothetical protein [Pedobacter foliorum]
MATNAKLEFYRFKLNHKDQEFKTFRDFAIDELRAGRNPSDEKVTKACFTHFIQSLKSDYAKDENLKKKIGLEKKRSINKYIDKGPSFNSADSIISGVINGGPYGRERIISNNDDEDDSTTLGINKAVLMYFYFFAYLPPDHNEGFFMIHSNSKDESITSIFRNYIVNLFRSTKYRKPVAESFCPKSFQDEFKNGAVLKSMTFKSTFVDTVHTTDGISNLMQEYDIRIEAIPKNKTISGNSAKAFLSKLSTKVFGSRSNERALNEFDRTTLVLGSAIGTSQKSFEWNTKDNEFIPVVYLKNRITNENADGTPDFDELKQYCETIFKDEILPEIRPDLNATRA